MKFSTTAFLAIGTAALTLAAPPAPAAPTLDLDPATDAYPVPNLGTNAPSPAVLEDDFTDDAVAAPLAERENYPSRVHYCQHANGGGNCKNQDWRNWKCYNMAPEWNDRISSIYTNPLSQCWLYTDKNCRGKSIKFQHPGVGNLKGTGLNDLGSSFECNNVGTG